MAKIRGPWMRRGLYYGWVIVGIVILCDFVQSQESFPILAVLLKPITGEFGWSRTSFTLPMAIGTVVGGFIGPFVGPWVDRTGPRWVSAVAFALLGGLLFSIAFMQELWHYYALQIAARAITHGVIGLTLVVVVPQWFIAQRGRAVAIGSLGNRGGQFALPPLTLLLVSMGGWRLTTMVQAVVIWALAAVPSALFLRRRPEDIGQLPDGMSRDEWERRSQAAARRSAAGEAPELEMTVTAREAVRTPAFYLLTLAGMFSPFAAAGLNLHLFSYLTDVGIEETAAVVVVSVWLLMGVFSGLACGFLAERFTSRTVTIVSFLLACGPVLVLPLIRTVPLAFVYALIQGSGQGGTLAMRLLWPDYFGRRHLGAIRGLTLPGQNIAIAGGPLAGALIYDLTGGYTQAFLAFGVSLLAAAACVYFARPPRGRNLS